MQPNEFDPALDRLMKGLEPPPPPTELRSKVLSAARAKIAGEPLTDVWSTIWNNRGIRLAWAGAAALLLAGHVLVIPGDGVDIVQFDLDVAENTVDEQFVDLLRPIRISENAQPIVGLIALAGDPTILDTKGNPL